MALGHGKPAEVNTFPYQIAYNLIPQIGDFNEFGYTSEEMKMQNEGRKIMHLPDLRVNCTCVRVPIMRSHSISIALECDAPISVEQAKAVIAEAKGCVLKDDPTNRVYPMPLDTSDQDLVFVCRIVRISRVIMVVCHYWCCGDQVRKGAATNAVQIAEILIK